MKNNITITNSIFLRNQANYESNCFTFTGLALEITSICILFETHSDPKKTDCSFTNNSYVSFDNGATIVGHGSLNFLGGILVISFCSFIENSNTASGAIFMGKSKNYFETIFQISNINCTSNKGFTFGGAIAFGSDLLQVKGNFTKINIFLNSAFLGGAIYLIFQNSNSYVTISESTFAYNGAYIGGVLFLQHAGGIISIIRCQFVMNQVQDMIVPGGINGKDSTGAAIAWNCYGISYMISQENFFYMNRAVSAVIAGISGIFSDYNSSFLGFRDFLNIFYYHIEGNFANRTSSISIQGHVIAKFTSTSFQDEKSQDDIVCFFSIYTQLFLTNVTFKNCSAKKGLISINSKTEGIITNLTSLDFRSEGGSLLSFYDIITNLTLVSIQILYSTGVNPPYINLFEISSAIMTISNIFIPFFRGKTIFTIELNSNVTIGGLHIYNISSQTMNRGCLFEFYSGSQIKLSDSEFFLFTSNTTLFFSLLADCTFQNLDFKEIYKNNTGNSQDTSGFLIQNSKISLSNCSFINYNYELFNAIYSDVFFFLCNFTNLKDSDYAYYYWGAALEFAWCSSVNVTNCLFSNLTKSDEGSAIILREINSLVDDEFLTILVFRCSFIQNSAVFAGGAIKLLNNFKFELVDCRFIANSAGDHGGAIDFDDPTDSAGISRVSGCSFINNNALLSGGVISIANKLPLFEDDNIFLGNAAVYGPNFASYPVSFGLIAYKIISAPKNLVFDSNIPKLLYPKVKIEVLYNSSSKQRKLFSLHDVPSGSLLNVNLYFEARDHYGQKTVLLNGSLNYIEALNSLKKFNISYSSKNSLSDIKVNLVGYPTRYFVNGSFEFSDLMLQGQPKKTYFLLFSSKSLFDKQTYNYDQRLQSNEIIIKGGSPSDGNYSSYYFYIPLLLKDCGEGEILIDLDKLMYCERCEYGKYTLSMYWPECQQCPIDQADCINGVLLLKPGFWRSSPMSQKIHPCEPYAASCLGNFSSDCEQGYKGPLCQTCSRHGKKVYMKRNGQTCEECYPQFIVLIVVISGGAVLGLLFFFYIKFNLSAFFAPAKSKEVIIQESIRSAYLKILVNYIQLVAISNGLDLKWSDLILGYFNINLFLSGSMLKMFSVECLFPTFNLVYLYAVQMSIIPFTLAVIEIFCWFAISRFKMKLFRDNFNKLITSLVIMVFTLQPTIINSLIGIISCKEIDDGKFYLVEYLAEQCDTDDHYRWKNFFFYPAFIFYTIFLPFWPMFYIIYQRKNHNKEKFKIVGFLFSGYLKQKFYWEFLFLYRKIAVIIIIKFFTMNSAIKALLILMILLISLWLQAMESPYIAEDLNSIDFKATFVAFVTIFAGLLGWLSNTTESRLLMSIIIFITNLLFLIHWIKRFMIQTLPWYLDNKYLRCIRKYLLKLQPEYDHLLTQRKGNGIMCLSNSRSSRLEEIPKKSSFFLNFKTAFSNLMEDPSRSPKLRSKKKINDPEFSFKTFSEFHDKILNLKSDNSQSKVMEIENFPKTDRSSNLHLSPLTNISAKPKSSIRLVSLSNVEEGKDKTGDTNEEISDLREIIHLQNKEIEYLNKKIQKIKSKLSRLRASKVFSKDELVAIFGKKPETTSLLNQPKVFDFNKKTNYFETFAPEIDEGMIEDHPEESVEIEQKVVEQKWAMNKGVFVLRKEGLSLRLKKIPYSAKKNPGFVKVEIEMENIAESPFNDLKISVSQASGELYLRDPETFPPEIKPKQIITQNLFIKSFGSTPSKPKKPGCFSLYFSLNQRKRNIKIILPCCDKLFVDMRRISESNIQDRLERKYTAELYHNRFLINSKKVEKFSYFRNLQPRLRCLGNENNSLIGKVGCFFQGAQIKVLMSIQRSKFIEGLGETVDFIIYGKNSEATKSFKRGFEIEENIVMNLFGTIILALENN